MRRTLTECSVLTEICQESSSNRGFTGAPGVKRTLTEYSVLSGKSQEINFDRKVTEDRF